jgi:hypothetical protein
MTEREHKATITTPNTAQLHWSFFDFLPAKAGCQHVSSQLPGIWEAAWSEYLICNFAIVCCVCSLNGIKPVVPVQLLRELASPSTKSCTVFTFIPVQLPPKLAGYQFGGCKMTKQA